MRVLSVALLLSTFACTRVNPAFDPNLGLAEGDTSSDTSASEGEASTAADSDSGDGDADSGEVDSESGDGDTSTGDGDGDTDTGTGDGDGDTSETESGDGDTGSDDTGDGDTGDGDCEFLPTYEDHFPFAIQSLGFFNTNGAPGFHSAPDKCFLAVICEASAPICDGEAPYLVKAYSSGDAIVGPALAQEGALQLRFQLGGGECLGSVFEVDPTQYVSVSYWNGQAEAQLSMRLPCLDELDVPLYIDQDGSTFWDAALTDPAALWR